MSTSIQPQLFFGDGRQPRDRHPDAPAAREPYIATPALVQAVNLAMFLGRPLLLEGEAGTGKTRLATAVAYELGLPLYAWYVRSTSKAQEGLYSYDAILRLHDTQTALPKASTNGDVRLLRDPSNPIDYRTLGAIGKAFVSDKPAVVLIDEIDKADVDFPNDLLTVLDKPWAFDIPETGEHIAARQRPIVIITSNKEKGNLPAPFLRRCIYHFIEFPNTEELLLQIVNAHYGNQPTAAPSENLAKDAIQRFLALRSEGNLYKLPGVSEFLDWLEALRGYNHPIHPPQPLGTGNGLPFPGALFKLRLDWQRNAGEA
jgi:MoxR-like ATPase